jgi:hypothetical protein
MMGEEFCRAGDSDSFCLRYVELIAPVVLEGWAKIPRLSSMWGPTEACLGVFEDECSGSWRGKGRAIEIELAK